MHRATITRQILANLRTNARVAQAKKGMRVEKRARTVTLYG